MLAVSCPMAHSAMLQHEGYCSMVNAAQINKPETRITFSRSADAARRTQSSRECSTSCSAPDRGSSGWRVVSREGPALITGCALQRRPTPMGLSRLADRELYQHGTAPTLVAQLDPDAALAEGRAALELSQTTFVAETSLPTKYGRFRVRAYRHSVDGGDTFTEPSVIMTGRPERQENVVVRVHDACFTSEVLGSLKCDCAEQLRLAMRHLQDCPPGIIIYLQQEGRGIGLANKIAAYSLQEGGLDTVDANRALGFPDDCREYTSVHNILRDLGVKSIQLMTNNPRKIQVLSALGVDVVGRVPCIVKAQEFNEDYMATKAARMSHELTGDYCVWNKKFYDGPLKPGSLEGEPMPPLNGSVANGNGSGSAASHAQQMSEADGSEHDSSDTDVMVSP